MNGSGAIPFIFMLWVLPGFSAGLVLCVLIHVLMPGLKLIPATVVYAWLLGIGAAVIFLGVGLKRSPSEILFYSYISPFCVSYFVRFMRALYSLAD